MAFLGTREFSAVLRVHVYVVCDLEKLGQCSHDPDLPKRLPTCEGWPSTYWTMSLDFFCVMLSCALPGDFAVEERATETF